MPFIPNLFTICSVRILLSVAAPEYGVCRLLKSYFVTAGCLAKKFTIGGATKLKVPCETKSSHMQNIHMSTIVNIDIIIFYDLQFYFLY